MILEEPVPNRNPDGEMHARQLTVFGAVKNIGDRPYITGLRQGIYVGPERSFEVGLRYPL